MTVTASGNTVTVMWSISSSGDDVTGYLVYYHHPNYDTTIATISSSDVHSDTFTERNATQRVYAVSVQALSEHFPSIYWIRTSDCQRSVYRREHNITMSYIIHFLSPRSCAGPASRDCDG